MTLYQAITFKAETLIVIATRDNGKGFSDYANHTYNESNGMKMARDMMSIEQASSEYQG